MARAEQDGAEPLAEATHVEESGGDAGEDVRGGELMPFDDGSMSIEKGQSNAASLVINFSEPLVAAGATVFGLNLFVLPLLARLSGKTGAPADWTEMFSYDAHGEKSRQAARLFNEGELKSRFGLLDAAFLFQEITMTTDEVDDHMSSEGLDVTEEETTRIQKWRDKANGYLKALQKRSALAFLGLPPDAGEVEVNKMYKKMALELHPDKGGDPEKFQELQEMKERLNDLEKEDEDVDDPDDEEAKAAKEKEKKEQDEESQKLPPDERIQKLRMDVHDSAVRLWQRAKTCTDEIVGDKSIKANAQPALNILRAYVDRFVKTELKTLKHDDVRGAEAKFRKFLKQGAEILAVAAVADVQATLTTLAMNFNFKLAARSGSKEVKALCDALMEAVSELPASVEGFLKGLEDTLTDQKERDRRRKVAKAEEQRRRESAGDYSGEAGKGNPAPAGNDPTPAASSAFAKAKATARSADPFADFDWEGGQQQKKPSTSKAAPSPSPAATNSEALKKKGTKEQVVAAVAEQKRTCWDADFDHTYAGALKSNGSGIFCRPCQRWIATYDFNTEAFITHAERAHPKPPLGWKS